MTAAAPNPDRGHLSPSLSDHGSAGLMPRAYELKFLLGKDEAEPVIAWAGRRLSLDPHGDASLDGAYRSTTIYLDTPGFDVYRRQNAFRRSKYRVRRYGGAPWVFLERKLKSGDRVKKRRSSVGIDDVSLMPQALTLSDWPGRWFHDRVHALRLRPVCRLSYLRTAFIGACPEGPMRLTLDRAIHGVAAHDWRTDAADGGLHLFAGKVLLELKFMHALPLPFKQLVQSCRLTPTAVSKYRACCDAWGMPAGQCEAARA